MLHTGTRVRHPEGVGTLIRQVGSTFIICSDKALFAPASSTCKYAAQYQKYCENRHYVETIECAQLEDQRSANIWRGVPQHIVLTPKEEFEQDGTYFVPGNYGRVNERGLTSVNVRWLRQERGEFDWNVPWDKLQFCRVKDGALYALWPEQGPEVAKHDYQVGDLLTYTANRPIVLPAAGGNLHVHKGALFRVEALPGKSNLDLLFLDRGQQKCSGGVVRVDLRTFPTARFGHPWIGLGEKVEIVTELSFRKQSLQGHRATVVVPTDADGDIGIDLGENLGAGSLDGAGRDGYCLYVPARAVRSVPA